MNTTVSPVVSPMTSDDYQIEYTGFTPSKDVTVLVKPFIEKLQDNIPYNSFIKATFTQRDKLYEALIEINSRPVHFIVHASEQTMRAAIEKVSSELKEHINAWRHNRWVV